MSVGFCLDVRRNDVTDGGVALAILAIRCSGIGPGPLGISETSPMADAPCLMASHASSMLAMQQIFTLGFKTDLIILFVLVGYWFVWNNEKWFLICICCFLFLVSLFGWYLVRVLG